MIEPMLEPKSGPPAAEQVVETDMQPATSCCDLVLHPRARQVKASESSIRLARKWSFIPRHRVQETGTAEPSPEELPHCW